MTDCSPCVNRKFPHRGYGALLIISKRGTVDRQKMGESIQRWKKRGEIAGGPGSVKGKTGLGSDARGIGDLA